MSDQIKHLSRQINSHVAGVIWLTDSNLTLHDHGLSEFNYLLNGTIKKNLQLETSQKLNSSYYLGDSFNHKFFIAHTIFKSHQDLKEIYNFIDFSKSLLTDRSEILIFNKSRNSANINIIKELSKKYDTLIFKHLNI